MEAFGPLVHLTFTSEDTETGPFVLVAADKLNNDALALALALALASTTISRLVTWFCFDFQDFPTKR